MTAHSLDGNMLGDVMHFDLLAEIQNADESKPWPAGRLTKTLLKKSDLRVLLLSLEKDSFIKEHHADGTIAIQVIRGTIAVLAQNQTYSLPPHSLLTLAASIKHEVRALEDSTFLLTIAWPSGDALKAMEHRGY